MRWETRSVSGDDGVRGQWTRTRFVQTFRDGKSSASSGRLWGVTGWGFFQMESRTNPSGRREGEGRLVSVGSVGGSR